MIGGVPVSYTHLDVYKRQVLGYPVALMSEEESDAYAELPEVQAMPEFPEKGSCAMVNGVLVLKLSEDS